MRRTLLLFVLLIFVSIGAFAQTHNIAGKVLDETGQGYPGAGIMVKGTTTGTVTDVEGNFNLDVPDGKNKLIVQALGYNTVTVSDTGQSEFLIRITRTTRTLEGAVVTAQGIRREKREIGFSSTTVNAEELTAGNNTSALSALSGKVAGANISSSTGGPGGSTRVILRGEKSISKNNNALIVVDGVITNNYDRTLSNELSQVDFGNSGNDINPEEVESITVLEGPAATALYGERGAFGAIMISTKHGRKRDPSGKASKFDITYKATYTQSDILKYADMQHEYGQGNLYQGVADDRRENFSWGAKFDGQLRPWGQVIDGKQLVKPYADLPNNVKSFFDHGQSINNFVSLSGGTDNTTYYLSINALNNKGVIPNTFFNKYSIRFNATTELSNNFYSAINVNYINNYSRASNSGQSGGSVLQNLYQTARDIPVWELSNLDNKYYSMQYYDTAGVERYGFYGAYFKNPYWAAKNYDNRNKTDRILGDYKVGFKKGSFNVYNRLGLDASSDRSFYKTPNLNAQPVEAFYAGNSFVSTGGYSQNNLNYFTLTNDLIVNFNHELGKNFGINAIVGHNASIRQSEGLSATIEPGTNGLVLPNFFNFSNNAGPISVTNFTNRTRSHGLYTDITFNFKRELFLELTGRNDWNSTLQLDRNSYFYPGANASWVFTERLNNTKFKKNVLNYGKIRFAASGVGSSGQPYANNPAGYSQTAINSSFGSVVPPFNGQPAISISETFGFAGLKPERTREFEFGTDLSFLNDRLSATFTYYNNVTVDLITAAPLPASTGFGFHYMNVGDISNKGIEITGRGTPIKTKWGLTWELFATYTRNRNMVERLSNGLENVTLGGFSGLAIVAAVGHPYGTFYGNDILYHNGRAVVDKETGLPLSTTKPVYRGSYQPRFIMSWGTDLTWGNLKLHMLFTCKQGGQFFSNTKIGMDFNGTSQVTTANSRNPYVWNNSVVKMSATEYVTNTKAFTPYEYYYAVGTTNNYSAQGLLDAGYIRLQEASLSYKIPAKLYKRSPFGTLEAGIFGTNLLLWTSKSNQYNDPEETSAGSGGNGQGLNFTANPSLRNYGISIKATF
jgi:TonB-linked SusC/RagA family outer membrane protein